MTDQLKSFSHSEYKTLKGCRRRWYWAYVKRLGGRQEDEPPTGLRNLGLNVHLALEGSYGYNLDPLEVIRAVYHETLEAHPEAEKEILGELSYALTMVKGFVEWAAETGMDAEYDVVATEGEVSHVLKLPDGRAVNLRGHLDQVVRRRGGDEALLVRDFKTVGSLAKADELQRNEQMRYYALLQWLRAAETSDRVDGVLYTMLLRSKRTARATPPFYETIPVHYNVHDHRSMLLRVQSVATLALDLEQAVEQGGDHRALVYPNDGESCRYCAFKTVCTLADDGSRFEDALAANFVETDPYGYYGSDRIDHVRKLMGQPVEEKLA